MGIKSAMSVSISATLLKPLSVLAAEEQPLLAIRILPPSIDESARRPYHLVLLIDVSGSMEGVRIDAVKRTLHLLIDSMVDGDSLSLIQYSSMAQTLAAAQVLSADTRTVLHGAVESMNANGGTNIEVAISELHTLMSSGTAIDSVFLLTDGHINQGIVSPTGLLRLLAAAVPAGTPVNTLGFGADHNSRMLRDMSVRSRGSYTYADAAELLPAIIGDIMGGLSSEVGRNTRLTIPAGWNCLEYGAETGISEYGIGTLIAEKPQWIVLQGPAACTSLPDFTVSWSSNNTALTQTVAIDASIPPMEALEQYLRAKVASTFAQITELLEARNYNDAKTTLDALGAELDSSPAHARPFVLRLRAQVDEMIDSVSNFLSVPALPTFGVHRMGGFLPPPPLAPMLSRLASNTTTLGVQRGFLSQEHHTEESENVFSTPRQLRVARAITGGYTHSEE